MKLKDRISFILLFWKSYCLYEVCLVLITEKVDENRGTVGTHRNADYLLKTTPTKQNKYGVNKNKNREHLDKFSFRESFGRIRVVLTK
jgi:hypothetical protein